VRALFEQRLLPLASGVNAAFVALLAAHGPLVHDADARSSTVSSTASANRCAASTRWRRSTHVLSGSQRNAIVSRTRAQVCYVLDSWLPRHYASDFLADSELFADCCAFLAPVARPHALAQPCRATTVATPSRRRAAVAATTAATCCAQQHRPACG
jgi:hypothetical protein